MEEQKIKLFKKQLAQIDPLHYARTSKENCAPSGNCKKPGNAKERPESARPVYSQTGSSGLAPAPELFTSGARAAATTPSGRL